MTNLPYIGYNAIAKNIRLLFGEKEDEKHTPRRNAVPLLRQLSARSFVTFRASCIVFPDAITAQIMAPADEPANGVLS